MSNELLGWMSLLLGVFGIVAARVRPIGKHSQRAAYAVGAGMTLTGAARLLDPPGAVMSGMVIAAGALLLAGIVSFVLSLKHREAFRARERS